MSHENIANWRKEEAFVRSSVLESNNAITTSEAMILGINRFCLIIFTSADIGVVIVIFVIFDILKLQKAREVLFNKKHTLIVLRNINYLRRNNMIFLYLFSFFYFFF